MKRTYCTTILLALLCAVSVACTAVPAQAAEKRWVISEGTALKAEASVSAATVSELKVGSELVLEEDAGRWLKVRAGEQTGWVYAGRVADTPPVAEVSGGEGGLFGATLQESQIETAKADSARSIRGLSPEVTQYAQQRGTPEEFRKALDSVLERKVAKKELDAFLREGRIGEYAQ